MGTPKGCPDMDNWAPELTEEVAEQWLAEMGLLPLVENQHVFAEFREQLKKLKGGKQYNIGNKANVFSMIRMLDDEVTHRRRSVDAMIMLFGEGRPDAQYALQVTQYFPGMPDICVIAPVSCCTVLHCAIEGSTDKGLNFTMPVELADGVQFNVEMRWILSQDAYRRFLKLTGTWLANHKPGASARQEKKALELMHGPAMD